jgi:MoxR-like ATPase
VVDYPTREAEQAILQLVREENACQVSTSQNSAPTLVTQEQIFQARQELLALHMAEPVERYLVEIVLASRNPPANLAPLIELGASPRGTIGLDLCARAHAWLAERDFVTPEDVQAIAHDVLRHRIICSFEADAQGLSSDHIIDQLLAQVPVP